MTERGRGCLISGLGNDCLSLCVECRDIVEPDMSSDSSPKKRYVSTLRMYIGPTNTSPGQGKNILATSTTSATATRTGIDTASSTGKRVCECVQCVCVMSVSV